MTVKCYMTNIGVIIGEVDIKSNSNDSVTLTNPMTIVSQGNQTGLANILNFFTEKEITISDKDIIAGPFTPITDVLNYYNQQFGSGLIVPKNDGLIIS